MTGFVKFFWILIISYHEYQFESNHTPSHSKNKFTRSPSNCLLEILQIFKNLMLPITQTHPPQPPPLTPGRTRSYLPNPIPQLQLRPQLQILRRRLHRILRRMPPTLSLPKRHHDRMQTRPRISQRRNLPRKKPNAHPHLPVLPLHARTTRHSQW